MFTRIKEWILRLQRHVVYGQDIYTIREEYELMFTLYKQVKGTLLTDSSIHHLVSQELVSDFIDVNSLYFSERANKQFFRGNSNIFNP